MNEPLWTYKMNLRKWRQDVLKLLKFHFFPDKSKKYVKVQGQVSMHLPLPLSSLLSSKNYPSKPKSLFASLETFLTCNSRIINTIQCMLSFFCKKILRWSWERGGASGKITTKVFTMFRSSELRNTNENLEVISIP